MAAAFDTLSAAKALEAAGMGKDHAEAIAAIFRDAADAGRDDAATGVDLDEPKSELKTDMAELKAGFKAEIDTFTWRMVGLAAVVVAAVKLIPSP